VPHPPLPDLAADKAAELAGTLPWLSRRVGPSPMRPGTGLRLVVARALDTLA